MSCRNPKSQPFCLEVPDALSPTSELQVGFTGSHTGAKHSSCVLKIDLLAVASEVYGGGGGGVKLLIRSISGGPSAPQDLAKARKDSS